MKKYFYAILLCLFMIIFNSGITFANDNILDSGEISSDFEMTINTELAAITVNGVFFHLDAPPQIINNDFMVPVRALFESIEATVEYYSETQTFNISYNGDNLVLNIGSDEAYLNGDKVILDAPVLMVNERTLVPTKAVMKSLGFGVSTNESNTALTIKYGSDCFYTVKSNGVLEITGNGNIPDVGRYEFERPWSEYTDIITDVRITEGIKNIGDRAFYDCSNVERIFLPSSLKYIGYNITSNIVMDIYYNGDHLEWSAINNNYNFSEYALMHFSDNYIEYAPESDFDFVNGVIIKYLGNDNIIFIPKTINGISVTMIADSAFSECHIYQVFVPDGVTKIKNSVFENCNYLRRVVLSNSVTEIGKNTFRYCRNLTDIKLPYGIKEISYGMFQYCSSLEKIDIPDSVINIDSYAFARTNIREIYIPMNVTAIDELAFDSCLNLNSVELPNTIEEISYGLFYGCSSLVEIIIPDSVTSIDSTAFYNCSQLRTIIMPNTINFIGTSAFYGCSNLIEIDLPEINYICENTFDKCYSLKSITIPLTVSIIGRNAFDNCYSLSNVYYAGSEEEWDSINIYSGNDYLMDAIFTYNYDTEETCFVYYSMNGGNGNIETKFYLKGTYIQITDIIPTRYGYSFLGWATSKYAIEPEYLSGDEYTVTESISLYAVWKAIPKIITNIRTYNDYKIGIIDINNIITPCVLCIAQYNNSELIKVDVRTYTNNSELFLVADNIDTIKLMAWDNLNTMIPICESETITMD